MSYSCLPSMKTIVASHNKQLLRRPPEEYKGGCNCRSGVENCPLDGQCKLRSIVYNATIQSREGEREYVGQTTKTFKERFNSHKSDAKIPSREKSTELSKYIWALRRKGIAEYSIDWSVASKSLSYNSESKSCDLCLTEKTLIAMQDRGRGLNKRNEIMQKCRHKGDMMLTNWILIDEGGG